MLINMCQQITGAALSAYLPTLLSENGFSGATAQIATLAPYGSAAIVCCTLPLAVLPLYEIRRLTNSPVHDRRSKTLRQIRQPRLANSIRLGAIDRRFRHLPRCPDRQQACSFCGADLG
jgi:hypothetical protein